MPRRSRISWKRRDDALAPSIVSSRAAAKRSGSLREQAGRAQADVHLLGLLLEEDPPGRLDAVEGAGARRGVRRGGVEARQQAAGQLGDVRVLDVARGRDDDVRGRVALGVERGHLGAVDAADDLLGADHGRAERVVGAEDGLGDQVVHQLLGIVVVHRDLLEHDLALRLELGPDGRGDHVAHDVQRRLHVGVQHPRVEHRVVLGGRGVELAAEAVEDLRDRERVVAARALEEHVLDEVREAAPRARLVARADADPEADRDRPDGLEALADNAKPAVELRQIEMLHRDRVRRRIYPVRRSSRISSIRRPSRQRPRRCW